MLKDKAAQRSAPALPDRESETKVVFATWESLRYHMVETLGLDVTPVGEPMPLSNIKRHFRVKFGIEVSETALGHSKLSELLQDERLSDICTVRLLDTGYFVVPICKAGLVSAENCSTNAPSRSDSGDESEQLSPQSRARDLTPRIFDDTRGKLEGTDDVLPASFRALGFAVNNTFIDIERSTNAGSALRRAHSCPRSLKAPESFLI